MNITLAWGTRVSPEFRDTVVSICKGFGWTPNHASWLMSCMAFESGETFSPSVRNAAGSGAVGLIQFMPETAADLRVDINVLASLTAEKQLAWVEAYFYPYASRITTLSDMYMAILLPRYVGQPEESILFSGGVSYRENSGLDNNHDGMITKAEATAKVQAKYDKGMTLIETVEW